MRKVSTTCQGGLSVLSAFSTGTGASIGIDLPLTVTMESGKTGNNYGLNATLAYLDDLYGRGTEYHVSSDNRIPSSMGLKSSSAYTMGIVVSYLYLNDISLEDSELIRIAAEASIANGTSLTGAADDLCASYFGGLCVADNTNRKILSRKEADERNVLILHGKNRLSTRDLKNRDFSGLESISNSMLRMIDSGLIYETMCMNGFIYGSMLGIDADMIGKLYSYGAVFAGQSGKGPAMFGIFRNEEDMEFAAMELRTSGYKSIMTHFSNRKAVVSGDFR